MPNLEWLILSTLPLAPEATVPQAGAPGLSVAPLAVWVASQSATTESLAQLALRYAEQEAAAEDESKGGSEGELPPESAAGAPVIYQGETEPESADARAPLPIPPLTMGRGEIQGAAQLDDLTLPTPGELYVAIGRGHRVNWQSYYRMPGPMGYRNRPQVALNLGIVLADAYLAVEARDSVYSQGMTQDLLTLASALGMTPAQLARGQSLLRFAKEGEWPVLRTELEATENEIKAALHKQRDSALVDMVSLGCWLRALQNASGALREDYSPQRAAILRQPELLYWLYTRATSLPPRVAEESIVERMVECLEDIQPYLMFDARKPPTELECEKMNRLLGRFMKRAVSR